MPKTVGNITLYMGPSLVNAPDNLEDAIIEFIDAATEIRH
jgi:hypothetical protein